MKIAIGSDHAGYEEKEAIKQQLEQMGIDYEDFGTDSAEKSVDYPCPTCCASYCGRSAPEIAMQ